MSAASSVPTRPHLRPWLGALLPFTALGLLPWWVCLALCVSLALVRLNEDSRSVAALLVLLAAALVSGPLLLGHDAGRLVASGTLFAQAAVVGLLSLASLRMLEHGQRRGLLLPAAALLLFPSPGGLAALLLAAPSLETGENSPPLRLHSRGPQRLGLALLGATLLLAGAVALLGAAVRSVPRQGESRSAPPVTTPADTRPAPLPQITPSTRAAPVQQIQIPAPTPPTEQDQALLLRSLVPLTGLLIVVCILLLSSGMRQRQAARRGSWAEYAALAGMLATLFMVGVLGAGAEPGGNLGGPPPQAGLTGRGAGQVGSAAVQTVRRDPDWLLALMNAGLIVSTLFFAALAVYLYLALRHGREQARAGALSTGAGASTPLLPPLHRVRLAWRGLETALAAAGLGRLGSETPEDFSARLAGLFPAAAGDLTLLTRIYLPVRYGSVQQTNDLGEDQANQAEEAAANIRHTLQASG